MAKTLRQLAEEEEQLPDGHPDWQHVAFGWQALAIAQSEKIIELEQKLKSMTDNSKGFRSALARALNEIESLKKIQGGRE
ncbi:hypothetical protein [Vreelandella venusta]|uniref:hypothetical protein n=1 Tax=Vreelandella venusta TaxID=44935 RepID=UPI003F676ECE